MNRLWKNFGLKIAALMGALVFWIFIIILQNVPYQFPEELDIQTFNLPEYLTLSGTLPKAKIRISAEPEIQSRISKKDFEIYIDLRNAEEGEFRTQIFVTSKNPNVNIFDIEPSEVLIKLEVAKEKILPVEVIQEGNPAENFVVQRMLAVPDIIKIRGSKNMLEKAKKIQVRAKLMGQEMQGFREKFAAKVLDGTDRPLPEVKMEVEEVEVQFFIVELSKKIVEIKGSFQGRLKKGSLKEYKITPGAIEIKGRKETIDSINVLFTKPIDLRKISDSQKIEVELQVPEDGVTVEREKVEVELILNPTS